MAKQDLYRELYTLSRSFANSILILFRMYGPFLKTLIFLTIAYLAFRLGRKTVVDPLQEDTKRVRNILDNRSKYTVHLPSKLDGIARVRKRSLFLFVFAVVAVLALLQFKPKMFKKTTVIVFLKVGIFFLVGIALLWLYQLFLKKQLEKGRSVNYRINEELLSLTKKIGDKGQFLLKAYLCKQKLSSKKKRPPGLCWKDGCKQERSYLKSKYQLAEQLTQSALTFQWCSICQNKKPFNEYLQFEGYMYEQRPQLSVEEQVSRKNKYLMNQISRILGWVKSISPCNCSKIYWLAEMKQIKMYKEQEKQLQDSYALAKHRMIVRVR